MEAVFLTDFAFDTGYAGPNGTEPQSWVNGNGTSYIYFGSGQFDGQGSGHDFNGTVSVLSNDPSDTGQGGGGSVLPGPRMNASGLRMNAECAAVFKGDSCSPGGDPLGALRCALEIELGSLWCK
eukprot:CAMPEP_0180198140 /NCGR_PEP_ID=MMETSP0987-20121128/5006_1 /TAXON_ID=697907 /ORGANISM="non described non described, Strain CCMP2293" /LENGTH=123 /DNA_ID=CAMNT_0022153117 /DNA_START=135 /DNA_END=508 /DNA_ORIENTATION=+